MKKKTNVIIQETPEMKDAKEFTKMYAELKPEDKLKVQGIMIGLQMSDQLKGVATA